MWFARSRSFAAKAAAFLVTLPLVFPPIALGYMLLVLLGRNGVIGSPLAEHLGVRLVFTRAAVALSAFVAGLPLFVRPVQAAFGSAAIIRFEEASRVLGCGPVKTFFFVTAPLAKKSILGGLLLSVTRAAGEVGITMMLGGNIAGRTNTLSLEIFNCVSRGDFDEAASLCAILAMLGLAAYAALERLQKER
ncbi:molybdate ABC transporter permease subunit [Synergistes jonesii]|uniref:molybdate ABC transporter permease subunit n=1 Tax=Synergistes jonesii TaxID=2754 RepID=UPI001F0322FD|nr:ABC transporter permease subunit [Synergistes jonesii]